MTTQHSIDDLDADYQILASVVSTPDEEEHVFNHWIDSDYDTESALRELKRYRLRIRQRVLRRHLQPELRPPPRADTVAFEEPCEPSDLVGSLTIRQQRIWSLRAIGLTNDEIGLRVGCSEKTVRRELDEVQVKFISDAVSEKLTY